jgi:hypothetical protein
VFGVSTKTIVTVVVLFVVLMNVYNRVPQFRKLSGAVA